MPKNNDDNQVKGLSDLIAESKRAKKTEPVIAEEKVEEKFEEKMEEIRIKELEKEAEKQAKSLGFSYVNLVAFPINSDPLNSLAKQTSQKEKVVCFFKTDREVKIASP